VHFLCRKNPFRSEIIIFAAMEEQLGRRIDFIDLTKGLCIMLVVMMHVGGAFDGLADGPVLSSFTMPLYFFVSGLFFKSYEGFAGFLLRKVDKLLVPFLVFYLGSFLLMYGISKLLPGTFRLPVRWSELLLVFRGHELIRFNPPIWFLVALFNCNMLFYIVHYLREKHLPAMFAATLLIGGAGFWLGRERIELPFYIDVAMTALPFYFAGFWIRRYNFFLFPHHRFDKLIPLFILLAVVTMYFTATPLGMRTNDYPGNLFQVYLAAFAGIFAVMLLCKEVKRVPVVTYLGRYSIITLGVHGPLLFFLRPVVSRFLAGGWVQSVALLALTLAVCLLLTPVIVRLMPQFVAQKDLLNRNQ
jgi:O-acetyl transferase